MLSCSSIILTKLKKLTLTGLGVTVFDHQHHSKDMERVERKTFLGYLLSSASPILLIFLTQS
jgi:hypothetical protein